MFSLIIDMWDDYHFKTTYSLHYGTGDKTTEIGVVKIASLGLAEYDPHTTLPRTFTELPSEFYSLGQDREYYEALAKLPGGLGRGVLHALRDVAADSDILATVEEERAFEISLLRSVPLQNVTGQFRRIIDGEPPLTPYRFSYIRANNPSAPELELAFDVRPSSMPPTNVHVLIGANGAGKSSLLRDFVEVAGASVEAVGVFRDKISAQNDEASSTFPFANVVHVAFSAFDQQEEWLPPKRRDLHTVGLKNAEGDDLADQFAKSLEVATHGPRRVRWTRAMATLCGADSILNDSNLEDLIDLEDPRPKFSKMSSGHKIVLITMTRLVELVDERSLVLIDEPETHLHPPLLSALARAISDLMISRNGVAVIATHSPVVLQEVPRSCIWMLQRSGDDIRASRLRTETFGESVSRLTSEVFHLDANRTGYIQVLRTLLKGHNASAESVLSVLDGQLGSEGRFILSALDGREDDLGA